MSSFPSDRFVEMLSRLAEVIVERDPAVEVVKAPHELAGVARVLLRKDEGLIGFDVYDTGDGRSARVWRKALAESDVQEVDEISAEGSPDDVVAALSELVGEPAETASVIKSDLFDLPLDVATLLMASLPEKESWALASRIVAGSKVAPESVFRLVQTANALDPSEVRSFHDGMSRCAELLGGVALRDFSLLDQADAHAVLRRLTVSDALFELVTNELLLENYEESETVQRLISSLVGGRFQEVRSALVDLNSWVAKHDRVVYGLLQPALRDTTWLADTVEKESYDRAAIVIEMVSRNLPLLADAPDPVAEIHCAATFYFSDYGYPIEGAMRSRALVSEYRAQVQEVLGLEEHFSELAWSTGRVARRRAAAGAGVGRQWLNQLLPTLRRLAGHATGEIRDSGARRTVTAALLQEAVAAARSGSSLPLTY